MKLAIPKKAQMNAVASPREMVIWAIILVIALVMGSKNLFSPLSKRVETAQSQLLAKQMELEAYKKFLKGGSTANKKVLEGMDLNRQAMAQKVKDAFGRVNMAPDVVVSELLSALTNPTSTKAALLEKFNFISEKKQSGYSEMNLDLKLNGTYNGIAQYLGYVRQLPYVIRIDSIAISNKDGQNNTGKVEVSAKAVLYVGDPKAMEVATQNFSKSDMATDILIELTGGKSANTPFSAKPREMSNWSLHELKLTSTMAGGVRPTALINGKVFTIGDEIADFKLMEVRPRDVVLVRGDVQHVLQIVEGGVFGPDAKPFITRDGDVPVENSTAPTGEAIAPVAKTENQAPNAEASAENNNEGGGGGSGIDKSNPHGTLTPGSGSGGNGLGGGSNSQAMAANADGVDESNPNGTMTPGNDSKPDQVEAQEKEPSGPTAQPDAKKVKLNPNEVEDIEGVPFEDLEDVTEVEG